MSQETKKPNFFIVGAAKAGTTSLWHYLKAHPQVFMPQSISQKEPMFFTNLYSVGLHDYLKLFDTVTNEKAIGEASTHYLIASESPALIYKFNPGAKIIIVLRNPVDRAYSLYKWMVMEGFEWVQTFEKALKKEEARLNAPRKGNYYDYLYFRSGLYSEQVARYLDIFPEDQLYVALFDDLLRDTPALLKNIYSFLEVDREYTPVMEQHNKAQIPFSPIFQYLLKSKLNPYLRKLGAVGGNHLLHFLIKMNLAIGNSGKMKPETRGKLIELYRKDISITASLINRDLSSWFQ